MTNIEPVEVSLDKPRQFRYTIGSARKIQKESGKNPLGWAAGDWVAAMGDPDLLLTVASACSDDAMSADELGGILSSNERTMALFWGLLRAALRFGGVSDSDIDETFKTLTDSAKNLSELPLIEAPDPLTATAQT